MDEARIYGVDRIASLAGTSPRTIHRWRQWPEGAFFEVVSVSNAGGGIGRAISTMPRSLSHFVQVIVHNRTSRQRAAAANIRWANGMPVNSAQAW